ncbi:heavy metal translocating P-type ATPase [Halalkalibaculum sp. DA384]|uniref:heavy metal translocating P-type ATPase n=1 Tax=Halalkalibaculum sp. DA384 TaxID=3373606 RepID=UPI003754634F
MSKRLEITVKGMDCSGCARSVQNVLKSQPGVTSAEVLLSAERAIIEYENGPPDRDKLKQAVEDIGYRVPDDTDMDRQETEAIAQKTMRLFGIVFGGVLFVVVAGEWLGLFQSITSFIPFWLGTLLVLLMGYPVFKKVVQTALKGQVIAHALMALGAVAALLAGEWVTAGIVVFFMRTGDFIEGYTTEKARDSVRSLTELAPQVATVIRDGEEQDIPVDEVSTGETVLVRPGGQIPVDGEVIEGTAAIDQSSITGESMPEDVNAGSSVYASTIARGGRLLVKATAVGKDSTFGRIIRMVEEAESRKGDIQQFADRFSTYYLPVVATIALLTWLLSGDVMSTVAVMVVACSCAFALATPVALLASIGSSARNGLLIKGGKYIELLSRADVLLLDKTGTLTFGRPEITDVIPLNGTSKGDLLINAAAAELFSEHPLAEAVVKAARGRHLSIPEPESFESITGSGVKARINEQTVSVAKPTEEQLQSHEAVVTPLKEAGKTVMAVCRDEELVGLLAAKDAERKEVAQALQQIRALGIAKIELLTGDHHQSAELLADKLGIEFQAELLPEDKIRIVQKYQEAGHTVVMVGDGINDAPALAQSDVAIAMGVSGTDIARETSHITLMRDDWLLISHLFRTARKTMRIIKGNFGFTTLYNIAGLSLAAFGLLPPILAAAAQSLPDIGILLNSSRLLNKDPG